MEKKIKLSQKIKTERISIFQILLFLLIISIYSTNFFLISIVSLLLIIFVSFWFRKSKKIWAILLSPMILIPLLMCTGIITLIIHLSAIETGQWLVKAFVSSFLSAFILTFYFITMTDDIVRKNTKNFIGKKIIMLIFPKKIQQKS